ncbi:MAG: translesion error-prone DNA polymerase V autoproteolytic subunit [Parachlamydiales bacterium]|nr:translesion error-prone DNA polymerase V autoproteolytic subunit [Parachlamydiales bacterium]
MKLPFFAVPVQAGFPSPAEDYLEQNLDLNEYLIQHPAATFFVRVDGDSMKGAGIHRGDILIVDRALEAANGKIVIAVVNGEFTVKRIRLAQDKIILEPENPQYMPLEIDKDADFRVWGVVTYVIHKCFS